MPIAEVSVREPLPASFYDRDTVLVARALLGQRLVRMLEGERLSGLICETEAYGGPDDEASHAFRRTPRSAIMYGPPGFAYVYFIYGMHHCLNAVTEADGRPGAVLIRGLMPREGMATLRARLGPAAGAARADAALPRVIAGPARLCLAFGITRALNGAVLTLRGELFIESGDAVDPAQIIAAPRIGVRGSAETRSRPWRFVWRPSLP